MDNNEKYENRIVCFLDILGFRNAVDNSETDPVLLDKVLTAIKKAREIALPDDELESKLNNDMGKVVSHFSDSFIISYAVNKESSVHNILTDILLIIHQFACYGFLVRGGVSVGTLIHTNEMFFGPGFHKAYDLEAKKADYARVLVDDKLLELCKIYHGSQHDADYEYQCVDYLVEYDYDGELYLNYLNTAFDDYFDVEDNFIWYAPLLAEGLRNSEPKVVRKYELLKQKIMYFTDALKKGLDEGLNENEIQVANANKILNAYSFLYESE